MYINLIISSNLYKPNPQAMLTVCEDETLTSFLKAGLKVRQCYISFKVISLVSFHLDLVYHNEALLTGERPIFSSVVLRPFGKYWPQPLSVI